MHRTFIAETADGSESWLQAFRDVQIATSNSKNLLATIFTDPTKKSRSSSMARSSSLRHQNSNLSIHSAASTVDDDQSAASPSESKTKNLTLFVAANGSSLSISKSKLASAKKELDAWVAKGAKKPERQGVDASSATEWRYGTPNYVLSDLQYVKGKSRNQEATPLESYVEKCLQTFMMEATHKASYAQWTSVRHEYFHLQVNDGERMRGDSIAAKDMFGLLYLDQNDAAAMRGVSSGATPSDVLAEAFPEGFPMEVLEVYTQTPNCFFSWRQWGSFSGYYNGTKGNGSKIEIRGFGQICVDADQIINLRLFYKSKELFQALEEASEASAVSIITPSNQCDNNSLNTPREKKVRLDSTEEIMQHLSGFTIASAK